MSTRVGDLVAERATETFVGRSAELAVLMDALDTDGPAVIHVHGLAGVGKSSLLAAFIRRVQDVGAAVVQLDCRSIEPGERRFLDHLGDVLGTHLKSAENAAEVIGNLGGRVVLTLDTYELFRLLDTWLRQVFVPALDRHVRVILVGREPPVSGWLATAGWDGIFHSLPLGPLDEADALELLVSAGVRPSEGRRINRAVHGHPLALRLAASAARERPTLDLEEIAIQSVVEELARLYLSDIDDEVTRRALEAASVVRRTTLPLLEAMLPGAPPQEAFARLRRLPFADVRSDGLRLHEAVQGAISTELRAVDPDRYRDYRRAAWRHLRTELYGGGSTDLWRYTADMLYLLQNPLVREGFFPSGAQDLVVEPARRADGPAVLAITERYDGPEGVRLLRAYWDGAIDTFHVVRRRDDNVAGFYCMLDNLALDRALVQTDPVGSQWLDHLRRDPLGRGQRAVFVRRWLSEDDGEAPSAVQAACWLDSKRTVMALRPSLRRCYLAIRDLDAYVPFIAKLEFREVPEAQAQIDGSVYRTAMLDWGPGSVDGWLARLVADELGVKDDDGRVLDVAARELRIDDHRVGLTKLEFGVMRSLCEHEGKVVTRAQLIEDVWGYDFAGESNVVDVIVRGLRVKLGKRASTLETVRGAGYRFRGAPPA